ncbi:MAG: 2Fe-2S iron-sulfur cluster-binding protein, partial [Chthoniobacteraceae bacterium]
RAHADPTDEEIDAALADSVCRCGSYPRMRKAIRRAAGELRTKKKP